MEQSLDDFINDFMNDEIDVKPTNIKPITKCTLDKNIKDKLFSYQIDHTINISSCILANGYAVDCSDTGTGKTYSSIATCKQLNLRPFIVCPKSIINSWKNVCTYFDVEYLGIVNYETIRNCKYYNSNMSRIDCPYISKISSEYKWKLPKNAILIFDEVHKCANLKTQNGQLLYGSKMSKLTNILMLSATIVSCLEDFKLFGYILGLYNSLKEGTYYLMNVGTMKKLNKILFNNVSMYGSCLRISELGTLFPSNQVSAECYTIDKPNIINNMYNNLQNELKILNNKVSVDIRTKILRMRQEIELLKIPVFIELTKDLLINNLSVVIFVNFTKTLEILCSELGTNCCVYGQQTLEERENNIKQFMNNDSRIIICNVKSGGYSINLHDEHGGFPRVSLISPSFSSVDLIQAVGRICRAGSKSVAIQKIIFCAGTIEDMIAKNIKRKLECLSQLCDTDLNYLNGIEE